MNRWRVGMSGAAAVIAVALAGCSAPQAEPTAPESPAAAPSAPAVPADVRPIVDAAVRDASSRLTVDAKSIEIVSARQVTWSDGSLGCPAEGMMYTQALAPGYRVILRAAGQTLDYHAGANGHVALCPPERAIDPIPDQPV